MVSHKAQVQVEKLVKLIFEWLDEGKVGSIQINFYGGGITNLNLNESIKLLK